MFISMVLMVAMVTMVVWLDINWVSFNLLNINDVQLQDLLLQFKYQHEQNNKDKKFEEKYYGR